MLATLAVYTDHDPIVYSVPPPVASVGSIRGLFGSDSGRNAPFRLHFGGSVSQVGSPHAPLKEPRRTSHNT